MPATPVEANTLSNMASSLARVAVSRTTGAADDDALAEVLGAADDCAVADPGVVGGPDDVGRPGVCGSLPQAASSAPRPTALPARNACRRVTLPGIKPAGLVRSDNSDMCSPA
jgi:hypothetical protein